MDRPIFSATASLRSLIARLLAFGTLIALGSAAVAAPIVVNDNSDYAFGAGPSNLPSDTTNCTLRKALRNAIDGAQTYTKCATGSGGTDTITFSDTSAIQLGTIGALDTISNRTIVIQGPKTIMGVNSGLGQAEIFNVFSSSSSSLSLNSVTLSGAGNSAVRLTGDGNASLSTNLVIFSSNKTDACCGGAISGNGTIALLDTDFTSNTANTQVGASGGAINLISNGISTITNGSFTSNTANNDGGAIYFSGNGSGVPPTTLTLTNVLFTLNTAHADGGAGHGGGAIFSTTTNQAFMAILNSVFLSNTMDGNDGSGGAILNKQSDSLPMVVDSGKFGLNKVSSNAAASGGAIYSELDGNLVVRASSFIANDAGGGKGGAIAGATRGPNNVPTPPTPGFVIANSTLQGNTAANGGAVYQFAPSGVLREITLINVTIDGNTASGSGGGIFTEGFSGNAAIAHLSNTIVSNNSGGNCVETAPGLPVDNVVGNLQFPGSTCSATPSLAVGDPKLNGPSVNPPDVLTLSMSLKAGSAASNAGDNATCAAFPVLNLDQRSLVAPIRPAGGAKCDIGAYESSNAPGYGSTPPPGSPITINTLVSVTGNSTVTIAETGTDDLVISSYGFVGSPEITVTGPAMPFTIADGAGSQDLTVMCTSAVANSFAGTLTVNHNAPGSPATYAVGCNVTKANQTINFPNPGPQLFDGTPVVLTATATSLLTVSYTSTTPGVCSVAGNSVTKITIGTCTINADQAGDANFNAAPTVPQSFAINPTVPGAPIIGVATPGDTTASITFTAPASDGGSPITGYTMTCNAVVTPGPGSPILVTGLTNGTLYTCTVTATNIAGTGPPSGPATVTPVATPVAPLITSANATSFTYNTAGTFTVTTTGTAPITILRTGALPAGVNFVDNGNGTGTLAGTPTAVGVFPITFTAANGTAPDAVQPFTLTVIKANQTINFPNPGAQVFNVTPVTLTATATSLLTVTYTSTTPGVCSVAGTSVTKITIGTCTINADQAGDGNYNPAPQVPQSFLINPSVPGAPIIGVATPGNTTASITFTPPASNGGSPITGYTMTCNAVVTPGPGSPIVVPGLTNGTLYTCTVTATNIAGTGPPSGPVTVTPTAAPVAPTITSANATTFTYNTAGTFTVTTAGTMPITISRTGALPAGVSFVDNGDGTGTLAGTPTAVGAFPLTFTAANGTPPNGGQAFTLTVSKASQTINFPNPGAQVFNVTPVTLTATATSLLAVTYTSTTPAVCSVAGVLVTKITIGTCTINADQAGNANYTAAPQVPQSFLINPSVPGAPIIGVATPGNTNATIAFTPPASNGGSPITGYTMTCNAVVTPGPGSPIVVPGLTNGTLYTCTVTATNIAGTGPPSGPVTVTPTAAPVAPTITSANATTFTYNTAGTFTVTTAGTAPITISRTGALPAGVGFVDNGNGTGTLSGTPTAVGTFPLTFTAANGTPPNGGQAFTLTVSKASQTINFPNPGAQVFNATKVTLTATATSLLAVTYTSATPAVCSVAGVLVTKITIGTCTINADQAGNGNYTAAPQVPQSFLINPSVPGAPTIGVATPGNTTATIAFTPPASNGGSPITSYTMTCNAVVTPGAGPPILVTGLTNLVLYTCTVTATNIAGTGPPSGPVTVTPTAAVTGTSGPSGTGTGTITVGLGGGGAACGFTTSQFLAAPPGVPPVPPVANPGITFPHGLFAFTVSACTVGSSVTFTILYPQVLPPGTQYWKYGPTIAQPAPHWYVLPAAIVGNKVTFTIADGGLGDDDLLANGAVVDAGGPGFGALGIGQTAAVPTLAQWALILLALLMAGAGLRQFARRGKR